MFARAEAKRSTYRVIPGDDNRIYGVWEIPNFSEKLFSASSDAFLLNENVKIYFSFLNPLSRQSKPVTLIVHLEGIDQEYPLRMSFELENEDFTKSDKNQSDVTFSPRETCSYVIFNEKWVNITEKKGFVQDDTIRIYFEFQKAPSKKPDIMEKIRGTKKEEINIQKVKDENIYDKIKGFDRKTKRDIVLPYLLLMFNQNVDFYNFIMEKQFPESFGNEVQKVLRDINENKKVFDPRELQNDEYLPICNFDQECKLMRETFGDKILKFIGFRMNENKIDENGKLVDTFKSEMYPFYSLTYIESEQKDIELKFKISNQENLPIREYEENGKNYRHVLEIEEICDNYIIFRSKSNNLSLKINEKLDAKDLIPRTDKDDVYELKGLIFEREEGSEKRYYSNMKFGDEWVVVDGTYVDGCEKPCDKLLTPKYIVYMKEGAESRKGERKEYQNAAKTINICLYDKNTIQTAARRFLQGFGVKKAEKVKEMTFKEYREEKSVEIWQLDGKKLKECNDDDVLKAGKDYVALNVKNPKKMDSMRVAVFLRIFEKDSKVINFVQTYVHDKTEKVSALKEDMLDELCTKDSNRDVSFLFYKDNDKYVPELLDEEKMIGEYVDSGCNYIFVTIQFDPNETPNIDTEFSFEDPLEIGDELKNMQLENLPYPNIPGLDFSEFMEFDFNSECDVENYDTYITKYSKNIWCRFYVDEEETDFISKIPAAMYSSYFIIIAVQLDVEAEAVCIRKGDEEITIDENTPITSYVNDFIESGRAKNEFFPIYLKT